MEGGRQKGRGDRDLRRAKRKKKKFCIMGTRKRVRNE